MQFLCFAVEPAEEGTNNNPFRGVPEATREGRFLGFSSAAAGLVRKDRKKAAR
jgi:hypothetical protein